MLQPDLLAASGQDKRSLPRRTDHLRDKGYITKVPVLGGGQKTSFLRLARYADEAAAPTTDHTIFYHEWFQNTIKLLKANNNIIAFDDIRRGLGIQGKRWETRAYVRCIRRLCAAGCVRRLTAKSVYEDENVPEGAIPGFSRCLRLLREPTKSDELAFSKSLTNGQTRAGTALIRGVKQEREDDVDGDADAELDAAWDDDDDLDLASEIDLDALDRRLPPQWRPELPYPNLLYNIIDSAGPKGITSMELQKQSFGPFFRRPLDELMTRLTDIGETTQPVHLKHLGIIRDTAMTGKSSHYVYRSRHNFDKAVEAGDAMWSAVQDLAKMGPKSKDKADQAKKVKPVITQGEVELDAWGFPIPTAQLFADHEGRADLVAASAPYADALRKDGKSHMSRTKGGKPSNLSSSNFPAVGQVGRPSSVRPIPALATPTPGAFTPVNPNQVRQKQKPGPKKLKPEGGRPGTIHARTPNIQGMSEADFVKNQRKIAARIVAAENAEKRSRMEANLTEDENAKKAARLEQDDDEVAEEEDVEGTVSAPTQGRQQSTEQNSNDLVGLFSIGHSFPYDTRSASNSPAPLASGSMAPPPVPKKRGRPPKKPLPPTSTLPTSMPPPPIPKKRGRPPEGKGKQEMEQQVEERQDQQDQDDGQEDDTITEPTGVDETTGDEATGELVPTPAPMASKKRGRPSKAEAAKKKQEEAEERLRDSTIAESDGDDMSPSVTPAVEATKKRGRPTKKMLEERKRREEEQAAQAKSIQAESESDDILLLVESSSLSKKRGRPTKEMAALKKRLEEAKATRLRRLRDASPTSTLMAALDDSTPGNTPNSGRHGRKRRKTDANDTQAESEPTEPTPAPSRINLRIAQIEAELLARSRPGVYINPPGAAATKSDAYFQVGRPRRALIAVIKTKTLHQLQWFRATRGLIGRDTPTIAPERPLTHGKDLSLGTKATKIRRSKVSTGPRAGKGEELSGALIADSDEDEVQEVSSPQIERVYTSPQVAIPTSGVQEENSLTPATTAGSTAEPSVQAEQTSSAELEPAEGLPRTCHTPAPASVPGPVLPPQNAISVAEPEVQEMDPEEAQAAIAGHKTGLIGHRRTQIILDVLAKCHGVFPGRNEMWFPFVRAWQQFGPGQVPDRQTVAKSIRYLIGAGQLRRMVFKFKTKNKERVQEHSIFALPGIDADHSKVAELHRNMMRNFPSLYIPPEAGVPPEMLVRGVYQSSAELEASALLDGNQINEEMSVSTYGRWKEEYPREADATVKRTAGAPLPSVRKRQVLRPKVVEEDSDDEIEEELPPEMANFRFQFQLQNYQHQPDDRVSWRTSYNSHGRLPGARRSRDSKSKKDKNKAPVRDEDTDSEFNNISAGEIPQILAQAQANEGKGRQLPINPQEFNAMEKRSKRKLLEKAGIMSTKRRYKSTIKSNQTVPGEMPAWQHGKRLVTLPTRPSAGMGIEVLSSNGVNFLFHSLLQRHRRYRKSGAITVRAREEEKAKLRDVMIKLQGEELEKVDGDWFEPADYSIYDTSIFFHRSSGTFGTGGIMKSKADLYAEDAKVQLRKLNTAGVPLMEYKSLVQRSVEGLEDILARAGKLGHVAPHPTENRQYTFNRAVDRVATWEHNLFEQGGCIMNNGWTFINHIIIGEHERDLSDSKGKFIDLDWQENAVFAASGEFKTLWEIEAETPQDFGELRTLPLGQQPDEDFEYQGVMETEASGKTDHGKKATPEPNAKSKSKPKAPNTNTFVPPRAALPPSHNNVAFKVAPHPRVAALSRAKRRPYIYKSPKNPTDPTKPAMSQEQSLPNMEELRARQRLPSKFKRSDRTAAKDFHEQDRMMICMVISRVLFGGVQMAQNWRLVAIGMRSRYDPNFLRRRWDNIKNVYETRFYKMVEEFQNVFLKAYANDETPKVDFKNVEMSDWQGLVEWFEKNVRVEGDENEEGTVKKEEEWIMPATREDFVANFTAAEREETYGVSREVQFNVGVMKSRREALGRYVYGTKLVMPQQDTLVLPKTWFRASVLCSDEEWVKHSAQEVAEKMSLFGNATVERVTQELGDSGGRMIKAIKKGRKLPGRNYVYTEYANSLFKRWPHGIRGVPEPEYLPTIAKDRAKIVQHFGSHDTLALSPVISDTEMLVLTQMVAQNFLKPVPQLPDRNDDFGAPFPKLTKWPYTDGNYSSRAIDRSRFSYPVLYTKTDNFTPAHALKPGVPIPMKAHPHLNELGLRIPMWVDIFGNFLAERWEQCLRSFLHLLVYRPGISAVEIEKSHKEKVWVFEIEMVLGWLEHTGVVERWGEGREDEWGVWKGGWKVTVWWYCVMDAEVRVWPLPKKGVEVESGQKPRGRERVHEAE